MDINQVKELYCKFTCPYRKGLEITLCIDECEKCGNTDREICYHCMPSITYEHGTIDACEYCQVDNVLKEILNNKNIKL